jgi:hypothetical protein
MVFTLTAQTIDKQIVATAGTTMSTASYKLTFSIGEPLIGTINNTLTVDQGFLAAASSNSTLSIEDQILSNAIKVYPNPVTDKLHIDLKNISGTVRVNIYNMTGKLLVNKNLNTQQNNLHLGNLSNGIYLVNLHFSDYKVIKSFKIIKK